MSATESTENLLGSSESVQQSHDSISLDQAHEMSLTQIEKQFLMVAERGDCANVRRLLEDYKDKPEELNVNCVDPLNRSALIAAIENENIDLIRLLLEWNIKVKDGLLHAIKEEYVEGVEVLLEWEERTHSPGQPYSWESIDSTSSTFTPDITPLILAAHMNNYEILKILLDRGATLPVPHDARCGCDQCVVSMEVDSLRHSHSRINAYRALTSPSLIALSSKDPLLTAFELSWELRRLSRMENEFSDEYKEMRIQCQDFAKSLLDHVRTSLELEIMLNFNPHGEHWEPGERHTLERVKLAIKYKQKKFVAHPNVQQLLASIWYEGLPGFRRKSIVNQLIEVGKLGAMFPIYSTIYMLAPTSKMGLFMKKPFVKFICHSSSYAFFLMLLSLASQRVEFLVIEWFGTPWMKSILEEWKKKERGSLPGPIEYFIIFYVISLIWCEVRALYSDGLLEYLTDLWNILDFITYSFYLAWIGLRFTSWYLVQMEYSQGKNPWYPREEWDPYDPMLISEGAFAAGMIFSYMKLVHIFSVNPHLGPLQISLGRMIIDILKFFFIYSLVLFAFGCGMNQLLWYYADLEKNECYHTPDGLPDFDHEDKACSIWRRFANLFETSQSLFWAGFGLVDLNAFELKGIKSFTRFWALLMFGSYSVINIIVLLNMLIAMMSNSYQIISEHSDTEWKFARSHLWMSYFEEGDTVPPPFNLFPTAKNIMKITGCKKDDRGTGSVMRKSHKKATERHETVMHLLVRRYVTAETRKRDETGISEDDVMEIRQDISSLRYELIDILRNNGMLTPKLVKEEVQVPGKKNRILERRLQKGFQIGFVEGIIADAISGNKEPQDVFAKIAHAIGRHTSSKNKKKDWNALVRQSTIARDPIGNSNEAIVRQSRQSLNRHTLESHKLALLNVDHEKMIEYNPALSTVSQSTRIAYAKFKIANLRQANNENKSCDSIEENKSDVITDEVNETEQNKQHVSSDQTAVTGKTTVITVTEPESSNQLETPNSTSSDTSNSRSLPENQVNNERLIDIESASEENIEATTTINPPQENIPSISSNKDFRATTPIPEENEEDKADDSQWETEDDDEGDGDNNDVKHDVEVKGDSLKHTATSKSSSIKKPPMKPGGRSKVSGEILTGWI